jgi:hypothetical protein
VICELLGDKPPSFSIVKNWVARLRTGHLSNEDDERPGRPAPENVDAIHSMTLHDQKMSAETLAISRERVGYIIHEI